ncbi:MAG: ABC transporter substrate-binding protein [Methanomicrobiales archaeon]|nr:ABC transporter substrate-binding protein [Methanomicrobiales archaeon]
MTLYVALDDTDTRESRGTGRLARAIARDLQQSGYHLSGVSRHQLLVHPDIPYTSHNSCAVIHVENGADADSLFDRVRELMLGDFIPGSDPGLAVAEHHEVVPEITGFGLEAKISIRTQDEARALARKSGIRLAGLGGTNGGVIGALAGIGLAASGNDGRFILFRNLRDFSGDIRAEDLLAAGVVMITTLSGESVTTGMVRVRKFPKPAIRNRTPVLFVEERDGIYHEVIRD